MNDLAKLTMALALIASAPLAAAEERQAPAGFTVVEADARIAYPGMIDHWERGEGDDLFLRAGNRWYLARLNPGCLRGAILGPEITLVSNDVAGLDRFSRVIVDERPCRIQSLDRLEAAPHE